MQCQTELNHTQIAGEVRRTHSQNADQFVPHLVAKLFELLARQTLEVGG
jgi:hypothetical protein